MTVVKSCCGKGCDSSGGIAFAAGLADDETGSPPEVASS